MIIHELDFFIDEWVAGNAKSIYNKDYCKLSDTSTNRPSEGVFSHRCKYQPILHR